MPDGLKFGGGETGTVIGALAVIGLGGLLASGTISKLRDHIRAAVAPSPPATDPFSQSTNPASPVGVGAGGDTAFGPNIGGGPVSVSGTDDGNGTFTMSGVVNYFNGGKLQQAIVPSLKGQSFIYDQTDPAAPIRIPSFVLDQIGKAINMTALVSPPTPLQGKGLPL